VVASRRVAASRTSSLSIEDRPLDANGSLIALAVIVGLIGFALAVVGGRGTAENSPASGPGTVIDRSIGMHLIRSLTGRSSDPSADEVVPPPVLTADEVAYRIGAPGAVVPERRETPGPGRRVAPLDPALATPATAARRRLLRDSGAVLVGLSGLALIAIGVFPGAGGSGPSRTFLSVSRAQGSPTTSPSDGLSVVLSETSRPSGKPSATAAATPAATRARTTTPVRPATPTPTPRPTPRPTPTPTPTPRRSTPRPTATPAPTPVPAPHAVISASASCTSAGGTIDFDGTASTGETSYDWNFNDRSVSTDPTPSHTFVAPGTYTVILIVHGPGGQDGASKVIDVPC